MKIVVLGTRGFPGVQGGVERHCEELYPRLAGLGCDVTIFTRTPYITKEQRFKKYNGINLIHQWTPRRKSLEAIIHTFIGILKAKKLSTDILHIHSIGPSLLVPFAKLLGLRVVMTHHGPDYKRAKWGRFAKWVLKFGERCGVLYSDAVIAISDGIKRHIKEMYNKDAFHIPNGVNIPNLVSVGENIKKLRLKPKEYVFTACRFVPEKGLHDLIEAYKMIKKPKFKLVIAGDADHETEYSRKLKRLALETDGVILAGFVTGNALQELFSNAGLFVLPSYYEGLPIALLEALSYGLPVLVSDIAQHKEIPLEDFRYFKCGDVKALSYGLEESFLRGISDEEKNKYILLLKEQYDWDNIAQKTLEVYKHVMAKNVV